MLGVLLASWLLRLFLALAPTNFAGVQTIAIDMRVLAFTVIVSFVTGVLFGLAPARRGSVIDANAGLRDTGTRGATSAGAKGASRILVVAEISLAMVLVIGAGLMVKSLFRLQAQDAGFTVNRLMTFQLCSPAKSTPTPGRLTQMYTRALDDIRRDPRRHGGGCHQHDSARQFRHERRFHDRGPAAVPAAGSCAGRRIPSDDARILRRDGDSDRARRGLLGRRNGDSPSRS